MPERTYSPFAGNFGTYGQTGGEHSFYTPGQQNYAPITGIAPPTAQGGEDPAQDAGQQTAAGGFDPSMLSDAWKLYDKFFGGSGGAAAGLTNNLGMPLNNLPGLPDTGLGLNPDTPPTNTPVNNLGMQMSNLPGLPAIAGAGLAGAGALGAFGSSIPAGTIEIGALMDSAGPLLGGAAGAGAASAAALGSGLTSLAAPTAASLGLEGVAGVGANALGGGTAAAGSSGLSSSLMSAAPWALGALAAYMMWNNNQREKNTIGTLAPGQSTVGVSNDGQTGVLDNGLILGSGDDRSTGAGQFFMAGPDGKQGEWLGRDPSYLLGQEYAKMFQGWTPEQATNYANFLSGQQYGDSGWNTSLNYGALPEDMAYAQPAYSQMTGANTPQHLWSFYNDNKSTLGNMSFADLLASAARLGTTVTGEKWGSEGGPVADIPTYAGGGSVDRHRAIIEGNKKLLGLMPFIGPWLADSDKANRMLRQAQSGIMSQISSDKPGLSEVGLKHSALSLPVLAELISGGRWKAPNWAHEASNRADEVVKAADEYVGIDDPQGIPESLARNLGIMLTQIPMGAAKAGQKGATSVLKKVSTAIPEWFGPTIAPSAGNYAMGAIAGTALPWAIENWPGGGKVSDKGLSDLITEEYAGGGKVKSTERMLNELKAKYSDNFARYKQHPPIEGIKGLNDEEKEALAVYKEMGAAEMHPEDMETVNRLLGRYQLQPFDLWRGLQLEKYKHLDLDPEDASSWTVSHGAATDYTGNLPHQELKRKIMLFGEMPEGTRGLVLRTGVKGDDAYEPEVLLAPQKFEQINHHLDKDGIRYIPVKPSYAGGGKVGALKRLSEWYNKDLANVDNSVFEHDARFPYGGLWGENTSKYLDLIRKWDPKISKPEADTLYEWALGDAGRIGADYRLIDNLTKKHGVDLHDVADSKWPLMRVIGIGPKTEKSKLYQDINAPWSTLRHQSTTTDESALEEFADANLGHGTSSLLKFMIEPKGKVKVLPMPVSGQSEFILPRGTALRTVDQFKDDSGALNLVLQALGQRGYAGGGKVGALQEAMRHLALDPVAVLGDSAGRQENFRRWLAEPTIYDAVNAAMSGDHSQPVVEAVKDYQGVGAMALNGKLRKRGGALGDDVTLSPVAGMMSQISDAPLHLDAGDDPGLLYAGDLDRKLRTLLERHPGVQSHLALYRGIPDFVMQDLGGIDKVLRDPAYQSWSTNPITATAFAGRKGHLLMRKLGPGSQSMALRRGESGKTLMDNENEVLLPPQPYKLASDPIPLKSRRWFPTWTPDAESIDKLKAELESLNVSPHTIDNMVKNADMLNLGEWRRERKTHTPYTGYLVEPPDISEYADGGKVGSIKSAMEAAKDSLESPERLKIIEELLSGSMPNVDG